MAERPNIKLGDWITVGHRECIVSMVRSPEHPLGDCEVVFDPTKPTNHDVEWTGDEWRFADRPDYGGYADKYSRLGEYVRILRKGRWI